MDYMDVNFIKLIAALKKTKLFNKVDEMYILLKVWHELQKVIEPDINLHNKLITDMNIETYKVKLPDLTLYDYLMEKKTEIQNDELGSLYLIFNIYESILAILYFVIVFETSEIDFAHHYSRYE